MTARRWCFTAWAEPQYDETKHACLAFQKEECPSTKKIHWQGILLLKNPARLVGTSKSLRCGKPHLEIMRGSWEEAMAYVTKTETSVPDTYQMFGEEPHQGKRTDLATVASMIQTGATAHDILVEATEGFIRYHRGIDRAIALREQADAESRRWRDVQVTVLWGPPGTGKTRTVWETEPELFSAATHRGTLWWDGYHGQEAVLIDDFNGDVPYEEMLRILDGYPLRMPIKGGHTWAMYTKVYITSNTPPIHWYGSRDCRAIIRRLSVVTEVAGG